MHRAPIAIAVSDADLDDRIATLETELAALCRRRRDRDDQELLVQVLRAKDDWFYVHELLAAPDPPPLVAGRSAKSVGRQLMAIADAQDRAAALPVLRLLRHPSLTKATLWKIERYQPDCGATDHRR